MTPEDDSPDVVPESVPDSGRTEFVRPDPEEAERMAARALQRAKASGSKQAGRAGSKHSPSRSGSARRGSYGDPQEVGDVLANLIGEQGWEGPASLARLEQTWAQIVGPEVAEHVQVEAVNEGVLRLRADSTAWATQLRLLSSTILEQVKQAMGPDLIHEVSVHGPQAPSWRSGPRVVKGRGPRDTYG